MKRAAVKRARTTSSQLIIGEVRMIGHDVDTKTLERAAIQLTDTWPIVSEDRTDGVRECDGILTFVQQLRDRNIYFNRLKRKESKDERIKTSIAERNNLLYMQIGCPNCQPVNDLSKKDIESARQFLLGYKQYNLEDETIAHQIKTVFMKCFPAQRQFFNESAQNLHYVDIHSLWPCLLKRHYLHLHYLTLTGISPEKISQNFVNKRIYNLAYGIKSLWHSIEDMKDINNRDYLAVSIIFQHLKEPMDQVFKVVEVVTIFALLQIIPISRIMVVSRTSVTWL
ncbi:hypothetical protein QAD02_004085 [Eretmocerus hayati]|uniref:Uncharacterized protein n=1 Tax=Eretmocerus hayati TaxID=131215 RepID=A0ACC2NTE9_9HYME|nr:hypothetical protein QAD02_004085 [Eretmocerus hayati]